MRGSVCAAWGSAWGLRTSCASFAVALPANTPAPDVGRRDFTRKVKPMVIAPVASFVTTSLLLQFGGGGTSSIPGLIAQASPFSKAVLLLLMGMSVYSWGVLWDRLRLFGRVRVQDG